MSAAWLKQRRATQRTESAAKTRRQVLLVARAALATAATATAPQPAGVSLLFTRDTGCCTRATDAFPSHLSLTVSCSGCTVAPTLAPTTLPTSAPSDAPTVEPSWAPSDAPTSRPSGSPTAEPSDTPTHLPTASPSVAPTPQPSDSPTKIPTWTPSATPTFEPTDQPTFAFGCSDIERAKCDTAVGTCFCADQGCTSKRCGCRQGWKCTSGPCGTCIAQPSRAPTINPTLVPTMDPTSSPSA